MDSKLRLIGKPAIMRGDQADEIAPEKAFQLLVTLDLIPTEKLPGTVIAHILWPEATKQQRLGLLDCSYQQLLGELARLRMRDFICFNGEEYWLRRRIPTDLDELWEAPNGELEHTWFEPVMQGWQWAFAEPHRFSAEVAIVSRLKVYVTDSPRDGIELLEKFLDVYPMNAEMTAWLFCLLRTEGQEKEADRLLEAYTERCPEEARRGGLSGGRSIAFPTAIFSGL